MAEIINERDREILRTYLSRRLKELRKEGKKSESNSEAAWTEGALIEIVCCFDELLGEQVPDLAKKPKSH